MANITIKNIPDGVYQELKQRAETQRRSLNSEIIHILEQAVANKKLPPEVTLSRARELRDKVQGKLSATEIQQAIDSGRP